MSQALAIKLLWFIDMEKIEIKAELYRIVRANQHLSKKKICELIYESLPNASKEEISEALLQLAES